MQDHCQTGRESTDLVSQLRRAEDLLRAIIQGTAGVTGAEFFRSLVQHLARGLQVRFAFVAECLPQMRARSLAYWQDQAFGPGFEYDLQGTPCLEVARGRTCHIPDRLPELFPEDRGMIDLGTVSYLGVPVLNAARQIIGHLVVFDDKPMPPDPLALSVMETFAARAGVELERERAAERLRSLSERRRVLLEITNATIRHLRQEDLLQAMCNALRQVMPFDRAAFTLYHPESDALRILAVEGSFESEHFQPGKDIPRRDSHSGWAFDHQKPLWRGDLMNEQAFGTERILVREGVRSICTVPLIVGGRSVGTINLASHTPGQYSEADAELLQEVANQTAVAVSNMRAFEDLQRLSLENEAMLRVNRAIGHHLNRDDLFAALAECLGPLVATDRFGIELPTEDGQLQGHILTPQAPGSRASAEVTLLPAAGTACDWVLRQRDWVVVRSREDLRERFPVTYRVMREAGMEGLCALPLVTRQRMRGALFFMSAAPGAYDRVKRSLLEQIAGAVAVALDDCLAHEEVRALRDRLAAENEYLQEEIRNEHNFEEIVGHSPSLLNVLRAVDQVAPADSAVLVYGETGTGKELIARAIHDRSPRKGHPLVKVNCGAISAGLVESELFGHVKGAFTGALANRDGRFKVADGGTLFLDEIGELPLETQVKLLRVLQEQEFEPIGSSRTIRVDVRIIAATNRDLAACVAEGKFRRDLYYRLNVFPIEVPPLRERVADIPLLAMFFLQRFARRFNKPVKRISEESLNRLKGYAWPGNIRELQNVLERAVVLANGPVLEVTPDAALAPPISHRYVPPTPPPVGTVTERMTAPSTADGGSMEEVERSHILTVLGRTGWMIEGERGAARVLNLHPSTLRSRMQKLGIKRPLRS